MKSLDCVSQPIHFAKHLPAHQAEDQWLFINALIAFFFLPVIRKHPLRHKKKSMERGERQHIFIDFLPLLLPYLFPSQGSVQQDPGRQSVQALHNQGSRDQPAGGGRRGGMHNKHFSTVAVHLETDDGLNTGLC